VVVNVFSIQSSGNLVSADLKLPSKVDFTFYRVVFSKKNIFCLEVIMDLILVDNLGDAFEVAKEILLREPTIIGGHDSHQQQSGSNLCRSRLQFPFCSDRYHLQHQGR